MLLVWPLLLQPLSLLLLLLRLAGPRTRDALVSRLRSLAWAC